MSVTSKIKQLAKLKRKAYRDAYVEQHVKTSLPFQIKALREQREWSQGDLGEKTGMRQNAVSRLEKPDYGSLSVNTLIRLASAFDVALLIKFVPFRKLLDEFSDLSVQALEVPSFDDELPELEEAAAMPNWYQGSFKTTYFAPRSLNFAADITANAYPVLHRPFRNILVTWEGIQSELSKLWAWNESPGTELTDPDTLPQEAPKPEVLDEMPIIDYTGESGSLAGQPTATGFYHFVPSALEAPIN